MAADWISPRDQLPEEGQTVEVSVLAGSHDISRAKRLGEKWLIEQQVGETYLMFEPPMPAYWRPVVRKQQMGKAA